MADGTENGERLGTSVTTNYPYVLAGGPGFDAFLEIFTDAGQVRLLDATNVVGGVVQQAAVFEGPALNEGAGFEVSLSDDLLLYAGENEAMARFGPALGYNGAVTKGIATGGGDVSQAGDGSGAFGQIGTGAVFYRTSRMTTPPVSAPMTGLNSTSARCPAWTRKSASTCAWWRRIGCGLPTRTVTVPTWSRPPAAWASG